MQDTFYQGERGFIHGVWPFLSCNVWHAFDMEYVMY